MSNESTPGGYEVTVSAIMLTYNSLPYLPDAIDSVRAQTFPDWELIVVDGASTDATASVLAGYTDPRIKVYRLPRDEGRAHARNVAVRLAKGKYIAPCDSDDLCLPERFAKEVAYLERHPEVDVVSGQIKYFWQDAPPQVRLRYPEDPAVIQRRFAKGKMAVPFMASMIRASCFDRFGPFAETMRSAEDLEWFLRIHRSCTFHTLPDFLLLYRHEVRGLALRKWLESVVYSRYAVYHAAMVARGESDRVIPFTAFSRRWRTRLSIATVDTLKYLNYQLRSRLGPRSLK